MASNFPSSLDTLTNPSATGTDWIAPPPEPDDD